MAILVVAREWNAEFEWYAHERVAQQLGLDAQLLDDLRHDRPLSVDDPLVEVVAAVATEVLRTRALSSATHERALELLGHVQLVELLHLLGYYVHLAILLNGLDIGVPADG